MKLYVLDELLRPIKNGIRKRRWSKRNPQSDTFPVNRFDFSHVYVGQGSYGELKVIDFGGDNILKINNYVSIAQNVTFILNAEHYLDHVSTYPFKVKMLKMQKYEAFGKGDIVVEDDVWIGYDAIIMSGVRIGQGAVVAAGAVVTKDIPPYAIAGGVPAKVIGYRFNKEIQEKMLKIDLKKLDEIFVEKHLEDFYKDIKKIEDLDFLDDLMKGI